MWRNYFSQLLNAHGVNDVRQTEIYTPESLVPELSASEFGLVIEKLRSQIARYWLNITRNVLSRVRQLAVRFINVFLFGIRRNNLRS